MFNWKKFVNDVDVVLSSPEKVDHLCYFEIQIHQCYNTLNVGSYKFVKESQKDSKMISFFESHGAIISTIIHAIEFGLSASEKNNFNQFQMPSYFSDKEVLEAAFEKGFSLQNQQ